MKGFSVPVGRVDLRGKEGVLQDSFLIPITLETSTGSITVTALCDTGAKCFAIVNSKSVPKIRRACRPRYQRLKKPIGATGYDGTNKKEAITHQMFADLVVDHRRVPEAPMLALECDEAYDVILGKWLWAYYDVALRPSKNELIWPKKTRSAVR